MSPIRPSSEESDLHHLAPDMDTPVTYREFRAVIKRIDDLATILTQSTLDRPAVVDVIRKHGAEIAALQAANLAAQNTRFVRRIWEASVLTSVSMTTALLMAFLGKGILVTIMAESLRLSGVNER